MLSESNTSLAGPKADLEWHIAIVTLKLLLSFAVLLLNGIVVVVYFKCKQLHSGSNLWLVHLSIGDFLLGITLPVNAVFYFLQADQRDLCYIQFSIVGVPLAASGLAVLLIVIERYIIVTNPYHGAHLLHNAIRYTAIFFSWALALLCMMVVPLLWTKSSDSLTELIHGMGCDVMDVASTSYWSYLILPLLYLFFISVIALYARILAVARSQVDEISLLTKQVSSKDRRLIRNAKLARTGSLLLGVFILCWLPLILVMTLSVLDHFYYGALILKARVIISLILFCSSAINPFLYPWKVQKFRAEVKKFLRIPLTDSDKYETYSIRRTFKIKRCSFSPPTEQPTLSTSLHSTPNIKSEASESEIIPDHITTTSESQPIENTKAANGVTPIKSVTSKKMPSSKKGFSLFSSHKVVHGPQDSTEFVTLTVTRTFRTTLEESYSSTDDTKEDLDESKAETSQENPVIPDKKPVMPEDEPVMPVDVHATPVDEHVRQLDETIIPGDVVMRRTVTTTKRHIKRYRRQVAMQLPTPEEKEQEVIKQTTPKPPDPPKNDEEILSRFLDNINIPLMEQPISGTAENYVYRESITETDNIEIDVGGALTSRFGLRILGRSMSSRYEVNDSQLIHSQRAISMLS